MSNICEVFGTADYWQQSRYKYQLDNHLVINVLLIIISKNSYIKSKDHLLLDQILKEYSQEITKGRHDKDWSSGHTPQEWQIKFMTQLGQADKHQC